MNSINELAIVSPWEPGLLSLALYAFMVSLVVATMLIFATWLGKGQPAPQKPEAYESGIRPTGSARFPFSIPFYLLATFFLIFDVEALYILSWAVAAEPLGWEGWMQITFFIGVLLVSLLYIWKKGGLEWGPKSPKSPERPRI
ncbi:MAG TPA: NADH-quinone oxidoreductase subunit A [Thermodesulfobacteriota bacterium]|nr:NADH-quinone oxidoreductase subunit A [Thermodesulfobacteriota bacterium]